MMFASLSAATAPCMPVGRVIHSNLWTVWILSKASARSVSIKCSNNRWYSVPAIQLIVIVALVTSMYRSFFTTSRLSTMHAFRKIVAETEETHGLRINFALCSTILIYYNKLKILFPLETKFSKCSTPILKALRSAVIAVLSFNTLPPWEILLNSPFIFRNHNSHAAAPSQFPLLAPSNERTMCFALWSFFE